MEDSQYKLIYFNIRGFGECIKYIFAYKNVEYDLETIPLDENWSGQKPRKKSKLSILIYIPVN